MSARQLIAIGLCFAPGMWAQQIGVEPVRPSAPVLWRPYLPVSVPAPRLVNSNRIRDLIRAGNLYLSLQDAIAIALENSVDIEIARYDLPLAEWNLERAQAGGALPGVPSGATAANSVANGQGVAGSQAAAGVSTNGNVSTNGGANSTIAQIGPTTQTLDPSIQGAATYSHRTTPEYNAVQSITPVLISNTRVYTATYQQGFLIGGNISVSYNEHYLNENAPTDVLNPSVAPSLSISFQQNLLRGFGNAVGGRTIEVRRLNVPISDLNFRTQVINTVVGVQNAYYALVVDEEDVKAKNSTLAAAHDFLDESRKRLQLGALAQLDVTSAESLLASGEQDMVLSRTSLRQQELQLKNLLSRTGNGDPLLASAHIIPLDKISMPEHDDLPPVSELIDQALANRSDLAAEKANIHTAEVSALGTKNGILPTAVVVGGESQAGLAGVPHTFPGEYPNPYFVGGLGNAMGQVLRRNFPTERVGTFASANIHNRLAQADYGIEQLSLRQQQLSTQKDLNQLQVDVANSVVALQQSRARYEAAVQNLNLQQQLLDAERKKFDFGASTPYNVVVQQRDLASAQAAELSALITYTNARVSLDQTTGRTLEVNHVSIEEARTGKVARTSTPPPAQ